MKEAPKYKTLFGREEPLPLWAYLAAGTLLVAALLGFALLLRFDLQRSKPVDISAYEEPVPDTMVWQLTQGGSETLITLDGYALLQGEKIIRMENAVVLYDTVQNDYLQLATAMVRRNELNEQFGEGYNYSCSGLSAMVHTDELQKPYSRYEICVLYGANRHCILLHTGQSLAEEGVA